MSVHPAGDGISWDEDVDVDQPHGLDYRYINHVAKAVRKRIEKEHKAFGDTTAGGEHLPGGCQVLLRDTTANMVADGTIVSNGLACLTAGANAGLFYFDDATVAQNVPVTAASICLGDDFTWTGAVDFDGTVTLENAVDISTLVMDGSFVQTGSSDMSAISSDGTCTFLDEVDISTLNVDGVTTIKGQTDVSTIVATGDCSFGALTHFSTQNVYDSSWFDASTTGTYTKTHDLSSTALNLNMFFKDVGNGFGLGVNRIYGMDPQADDSIEYGCAATNITTTQVTVQGGNDGVAYSLNTAGSFITCASGEFRVIATRLL